MPSPKSSTGNTFQLFDLIKLSESLIGPEFVAIANAIRRLRDAYSIKNDLLSAMVNFELILKFASNQVIGDPVHQSDDEAAIIGSLFVQSLIFYCRATKTESDHRVQSPVAQKYSPKLKQTHLSICRLRDDVIAHFGPGTGHASGTWYREALVLSLRSDGKHAFMNPYVRANYKQEAVQDLYELLQNAVPLSYEIADDRAKTLDRLLEQQPEDSPIWKKIQSTVFLPDEFFSTAQAASSFLATLDEPGEAHFGMSLHPSGQTMTS